MDNYARIKAAKSEKKADLVIKNAKICDLACHEIYEGDVAVADGVIVGCGSYEGEVEIDAEGGYVMPSFVESHVHIESSMLTPAEFAKLEAAWGVTEVIADPHEIANVAGEDGLEFMINSAQGVPIDIHFMLPSCVPATEFDDAGAVIGAGKTAELMKKYDFFGVGEMMNYVGLLNLVPDVVEKVTTERCVDGHAPLLSGKELNAYAAAGIRTDHECTNEKEALEKISKGMYVMMREGTQSKNIEGLYKAVNPYTLRRFLFCTDDRYLGDVMREGSISNCVKKAVGLGMDSLDALIIACLNPSECYNLGRRGLIAPSYKADMIISRDLTAEHITHVFKDGKLIAKDGKALFETKNADASKVKNSVHIAPVASSDFALEYKKGMPVIEVFPKSLWTKCCETHEREELNLCAVIERHKGTGRMGKCFIKGFDLKGGAIAQTIGHDSHNITVLGDDTASMAAAVNALGTMGGMSVAKGGRAIAYMPLEIAGLMSDKCAEETLCEHDKIISAMGTLEVNSEIDPFMLLSFLSLLVIPSVKISDRGLFDVEKWRFFD
ncbi:MAG: adenine deaminase [Clostridia bacterium]|nr:adenine deaminase [Clostridia bacterium]